MHDDAATARRDSADDKEVHDATTTDTTAPTRNGEKVVHDATAPTRNGDKEVHDDNDGHDSSANYDQRPPRQRRTRQRDNAKRALHDVTTQERRARHHVNRHY